MEARQETEKDHMRYEQEQKLAGEEKDRLEKQYKEAPIQYRLERTTKSISKEESALKMQQFHR